MIKGKFEISRLLGLRPVDSAGKCRVGQSIRINTCFSWPYGDQRKKYYEWGKFLFIKIEKKT